MEFSILKRDLTDMTEHCKFRMSEEHNYETNQLIISTNMCL